MVSKAALLQAIYGAIQWDQLYEAMPGLSRDEVDELFRQMRQKLEEVPDAPPELAAQIAGGAARLYCDGASLGNPGPAAVGMVLTTADELEIMAWGAPIGHATNNVAEYQAAIHGLRQALELKVARIRLLSDSELLIRQLQGTYKVKNAGLQPLHAEARVLLGQFDSYEVEHVAREQNKRADALAAEHARRQPDGE
ncbi:MAG: ribonuclease HI family protein [Planctomycetota bacterium]|jgi:ribonuclease HI